MTEIREPILDKFFEQILSGAKTFALQTGDFKCDSGDTIIFEEVDKSGAKTGRTSQKRAGSIANSKEIDDFAKAKIDKFGLKIISLKNENPETQLIDKIALIFIKNGQLLCTRSRGKAKFYLPGGKRRTRENDAQTLIREIREELGVDILPDTIKYFGTFEAQADGKSSGVIVRETCYFAKFSGEPKPSAEIEELAYLSYDDKSQTTPVGYLVFDDLFNKFLIKEAK